ncbi:MAG: aldehyde ferredoxin oxidoreductase family protein [Candidatus Acetothermia bacterium]|jgi:aldehyde:ferredoxin oxidoreductase|nr:aldehyde ferredoxin oxidoreductase family protein [Candidatus Acetothermia bacterium]MDH7505359.1 aldehyde ferredoxin oxidoreductase family protein [Candidatus Acetothermia bacterium]
MAAIDGAFGRYLLVDLNSGRFEDYPIPEGWLKRHLGGRGIGARILLEELKDKDLRELDPLGPENLLVFATGPFQGLGIAGGGRHVVLGLSPKTRAASDSYAGGFFGQELGHSGYDGLIIKGRAARPVYLTLIAGKPALHEAHDLWGLETAEVEEELQRRHGKVRVATIGPAGERLVKFACIIHDRTRSAGRPGFGAVMGSKNLKAIAVLSHTEKPIHDRARFLELRKELALALASERWIRRFRSCGTAGGVMALNGQGILPTKNFQEGVFDRAGAISGEVMAETILVRADSCAGCPVGCKRVVSAKFDNEEVDPRYGGPEYETVAALGSLLLNDDLEAIALANQKCNAYGLDTISTGVTIAWAIEATERGLLKSDLKWGDARAILRAIDLIARREGLGAELAKGLDYLEKKYGGDFAVHVKGVEVPMHEPRGKVGLALSYATSPRGATHLEGMHDTMLEVENPTPELGVTERLDRFSWEGKPRVVKIYEDLRSFTNSLVMCVFIPSMTEPGYNYPQIRAILNALTGLEVDAKEMLLIGERNYNLLKILAARAGYTRRDDDLPRRLKGPLPRGASSGRPIPNDLLQRMIDEYYRLRGWDEFGPTPAKLEELGLGELKRILPR